MISILVQNRSLDVDNELFILRNWWDVVKALFVSDVRLNAKPIMTKRPTFDMHLIFRVADETNSMTVTCTAMLLMSIGLINSRWHVVLRIPYWFGLQVTISRYHYLVNHGKTSMFEYMHKCIRMLKFNRCSVSHSCNSRTKPCRRRIVIYALNKLRPRQDDRSFTDAILKMPFLNENVWISLKISLNYISKDPLNDISSLVWITAWRWPGDMTLSEPLAISLMRHICVTRPQWIN